MMICLITKKGSLMNPTIDLLKAHRSIRQFQNRRIQPDLFEDLIKAGQAAASSNFFQAATIIRVTDLQKRSKLASLANNQAYVETACRIFGVLC
jgi:nitroreductase